MIQHTQGPSSIWIIPEDILNAYNIFASSASIYTQNPLVAKQVTAQPANQDNNYNISRLTQAGLAGITRGTGFQIGADGLLYATRDMYAIDVSLFCTAKWAEGHYIGVGICIGDPNNLPQFAGQDIQGKQYVSRFHDEQQGRSSRILTLNISQQPVGRSTFSGIGVFQGDKIFPVIWGLESSSTTVSIYDLIMSITELPQSV